MVPTPVSIRCSVSLRWPDQRDGIVDGFEVNLAPLAGMTEHTQVMAWWRTQPEAWSHVTKDQRPAGEAIASWAEWVQNREEVRVFVAHPITFDGVWVDWYLRRFLDMPLFRGPMQGDKLVSDTGLDLPSFAMAVLGRSVEEVGPNKYPAEWLGDVPHSHRAIDDAKGYAHLLLRLLSTST